MYPILVGTIRVENDTQRDAALRTFARLEYGETHGRWLTASLRLSGPSIRERVARRLRHWINSFRGSTIYDARDVDDSDPHLADQRIAQTATGFLQYFP